MTRLAARDGGLQAEELEPLIDRVQAFSGGLIQRSDAELRRRAVEIRSAVRVAGERVRIEAQDLDEDGEAAPIDPFEGVLNEVLAEWFALVRETARRVLGLSAFDVQLLGASALHRGHVVEMATGEGKTLVAVFPASLAALTGRGVQVWTVNDYLAGRDARWMAPLYEALGLRVAAISQTTPPGERRLAYRADVTYLTANEAGFDFLRDSLARRVEDVAGGPCHTVLIDEVDSILIDEARIPLVIAGGVAQPGDQAYRLAELASHLRPGVHYQLDDLARNVALTDVGIAEVEGRLGCGSLFDEANLGLLTAVNVALHARAFLRRDVDYVIKGGAVRLVDEFKGRIADRRRWPDGIHTALEAQEGLPLTRDGRVLGSITLQSLVALYPKVSGMTGTAITQAAEFRSIYGLSVVEIPPNRPCVRIDHPDLVFSHREAKEAAVVEEIRRLHESGRPVLVGTASVEESESLASRLGDLGLSCQVLNARNDEREAAIIAEAGAPFAITISTNMAGRGVDIRLGGSGAGAKAAENATRVKNMGGLFVLGTNRHENRRIDNQLRGRAGRQGDPGETRFFISLEDDLFTRHGVASAIPEAIQKARQDGPLKDPRVGREIDRSQRILEGQNLDIRRNLYRYDLLLERQRQALFQGRQETLLGAEIDEAGEFPGLLREASKERWESLSAKYGEALLYRVEREITLAHIDRLWADHLEDVAELREGIHLRSLAAGDVLGEFQRAIVGMFDDLPKRLDEEIVKTFERAEITEAGIDLGKEGLAAPSSTWTYLVTDQPFGTLTERFLKGLRRMARGALGGGRA